MSDLWSLWWIWMSGAILLAILEVLAPGSIFLGFAIGAAIVGLLLLTPLNIGLPALLMVFAILSLIAWILLRRYFRTPDGNARMINEDIND